MRLVGFHCQRMLFVQQAAGTYGKERQGAAESAVFQSPRSTRRVYRKTIWIRIFNIHHDGGSTTGIHSSPAAIHSSIYGF